MSKPVVSAYHVCHCRQRPGKPSEVVGTRFLRHAERGGYLIYRDKSGKQVLVVNKTLLHHCAIGETIKEAVAILESLK